MKDADLGDVLGMWEETLSSLREVLDLEVSTIARDAAIKRFEYNFELAWKTVKHFAIKRRTPTRRQRRNRSLAIFPDTTRLSFRCIGC